MLMVFLALMVLVLDLEASLTIAACVSYCSLYSSVISFSVRFLSLRPQITYVCSAKADMSLLADISTFLILASFSKNDMSSCPAHYLTKLSLA